jgi:hypothetical protein
MDEFRETMPWHLMWTIGPAGAVAESRSTEWSEFSIAPVLSAELLTLLLNQTVVVCRRCPRANIG